MKGHEAFHGPDQPPLVQALLLAREQFICRGRILAVCGFKRESPNLNAREALSRKAPSTTTIWRAVSMTYIRQTISLLGCPMISLYWYTAEKELTSLRRGGVWALFHRRWVPTWKIVRFTPSSIAWHDRG